VELPPISGDPYYYVPLTQSNPGTSGVAVAWDNVRAYWGRIINEAWWEMEAIQTGGVILI
jgi:hypothetical protein